MPNDLKVVIAGDARKYERTLEQAESRTRRFGKALGDMGKIAGGILLSEGLQKVAEGLRGTVKAAEESERVQAAMEAQLRASGESYAKLGGQIDSTVNSLSKMSGLDDEDLASAFTRLDRASGDAKASLGELGLVADIARARNIDVAKAADLVAKAMDGNAGALRRYGVEVEKGASAHEILAAAQAKFAGQAQAYGETAAGAHDKVNVAVENLQESIGSKLLPAWNSMLTWAAEQLPKVSAFFDSNSGTIKRVIGTVSGFIKTEVVPRLNDMRTVAESAIKGFRKVIDDNGPQIKTILGGIKEVAKTIGDTLRWVTEKIVIPILKPMLETVLPVAVGITVRALAKLFNIIGDVKGGIKWIGDNAARIFLAVKDKLGGPLATLHGIFSPVAEVLRQIVSHINDVINLAGKLSGAVGKITGALGSIGGILGKVRGLATGGTAFAGQPVIVGERGPELFVPGMTGTVLTAADTRSALAGGGGTAIGGGAAIFNITLEVDGRELWNVVRKYGIRDSRYIVGSTDLVGALR